MCDGCWSRDDREIESKKNFEFELELVNDEPEFDESDVEVRLLETGEFMLRPPYKYMMLLARSGTAV
jgi:hypothetical protein